MLTFLKRAWGECRYKWCYNWANWSNGNRMLWGKAGAQQSPLPVPVFTARRSFRWWLSPFSCKWCWETAYKNVCCNKYCCGWMCQVLQLRCDFWRRGCISWFVGVFFFFFLVYRAGRTSEVRATLLELHQQSKGSPLSPIPARSVPWYGGSNRTGGKI